MYKSSLYTKHDKTAVKLHEHDCYTIGCDYRWRGLVAWADGRVKGTGTDKTTIDEGVFKEIEICVRDGKVMATGSERGSSTDVALRWKKVMF